MARRSTKNAWAVCEIVEGKDVPEVLQGYPDREDAANALRKARDALEGMKKYNVVMLPLSPKGDPLLPPGVTPRAFKDGEAEPKAPKRKKGKQDEEDIAG